MYLRANRVACGLDRPRLTENQPLTKKSRTVDYGLHRGALAVDFVQSQAWEVSVVVWGE